MENDEVVTAIEYYNFPESGHEKYGVWWIMELCAMSIFTSSSTETLKQYGPFSTDCEGNATERVYGEIPSNTSFQEFLSEFSFIGSNDYLSMKLPPWTSRDPKDFSLPEDNTFSANSFNKMPSDEVCISSMDCDEGSICNFVNEGGSRGFCESCEGFNSDQDCENYFITAEGRRECKSGCVKNFNHTVNVLQDLSESERSTKPECNGSCVVDQDYFEKEDLSESDHSAITTWFSDFIMKLAPYHQIILLCIFVFVSMIMANLFARCLFRMERSNYNVSITILLS